MARLEGEHNVSLSVIDRLIDADPGNRFDGAMTRAQSVRALKQSLRRDLEWLLNSRRIALDEVETSFPETSKSLFYYGLPDFTALSFASPKDRQRLLRQLEQTIRTFEPRLASVKVTAIENATDLQQRRLMRFQIEGLLKMDPAPEHVSFDTVLQLTSGDFTVRGEAGA
ncbi:MAG TPA: type VI secretion system baseplate subunit TssE [Bryobacteraceae bacterium]|jgi:type VI secretion system protein ImpF|nr:type VI secretion system baseplate subunit TssE [Bryobacteraceae bacterium]